MENWSKLVEKVVQKGLEKWNRSGTEVEHKWNRSGTEEENDRKLVKIGGKSGPKRVGTEVEQKWNRSGTNSATNRYE